MSFITLGDGTRFNAAAISHYSESNGSCALYLIGEPQGTDPFIVDETAEELDELIAAAGRKSRIATVSPCPKCGAHMVKRWLRGPDRVTETGIRGPGLVEICSECEWSQSLRANDEEAAM